MTGLAAVLLVAVAAWLWVTPWRSERPGRLVGRVPTSGSRTVLRWARTTGLALGGRLGLGPASRRRRARARVRVVQALAALSAELEAGQPPLAALASAGGEPSAWPAAAAVIRLDGDVAGALGIDAATDPVLGQLAACWQVASASGAGLAASVTRLAASARSAEDVRVNLEAQLAGPRATARMLGTLPLVGIGFGMMLGSDPLSWLLSSTPGRACLLTGAALVAVGSWWTGRIAAAVERML